MNINSQWFEALVYKNFAFLGHLVLRDVVQICERLVQECGDVLDLLQYLSVVAAVDELN